MFKRLFVITIISSLCFGCSTDIDLTAPYQDITVIFGILDQTRDVHFVKINKAFLGDEPLADMAAVRDSVEYDDGLITSKRVEEWLNGIKTNEWELKDSLVEAINESIFYVEGITDPLRKVFYFEENNLNEDAEYKLVVEFENKEKVEGFTNLIPDSPGAITKPVSNEGTQTGQSLGLANSTSNTTGIYPIYRFKWNAEENARRYEINLDFRYIENVWQDECHEVLISSEEKVLSMFLGSVKTNDASGTDELEFNFFGEEFFLRVKDNLVADPLITREIGVLDESLAPNHYSVFDFNLNIADEDFNSYLEFNEPVTGLAQERPQWTNINGGQGVFSSKLEQSAINIKMNVFTTRSLATGPITSDLNFCTKDFIFQDEDFFCQGCN